MACPNDRMHLKGTSLYMSPTHCHRDGIQVIFIAYQQFHVYIYCFNYSDNVMSNTVPTNDSDFANITGSREQCWNISNWSNKV